MTLMCKINKLEKPSGPEGNFHTLFGRSPTFYDHFQVDVVTSEWSTGISSSPVTQTNLLNELNLPQSITFPIPTSLPLKLTLTQETTSLLPFSSKFTFLGNKNSCDGHISFPPSKNSGPFHHNKQIFTLPTEYSLVQISAGFKDVGTKPQFSTLTFSRIVSSLFWIQIFHSLHLC